MKTIEDLAKSINETIEQGKLFWAYGLMQETYKIWTNDDNRKYLSELALQMFYIARDDPNATK